jgi:hypothetical protein
MADTCAMEDARLLTWIKFSRSAQVVQAPRARFRQGLVGEREALKGRRRRGVER